MYVNLLVYIAYTLHYSKIEHVQKVFNWDPSANRVIRSIDILTPGSVSVEGVRSVINSWD